MWTQEGGARGEATAWRQERARREPPEALAFGAYETVQRTQAVNGPGLVSQQSLLKLLLAIAPNSEILASQIKAPRAPAVSSNIPAKR